MEHDPESLTIGAVAVAAGVGVETIRFYQRKGLLDEPDRPPGGIRRYGRRDVERIGFIKSAKQLGFSLDEVMGLLVLEDGTQCDDARTRAEAKLDDVKHKLAGLRRIERALRTMIADCKERKGEVCCPMIQALRSASEA